MKKADAIYESLPYCHSGHRYIRGIGDIEAILRDARRQGMLDAAEIAVRREPHGGISDMDDVDSRSASLIRRAILDAAKSIEQAAERLEGKG